MTQLQERRRTETEKPLEQVMNDQTVLKRPLVNLLLTPDLLNGSRRIFNHASPEQ